MITTVYTPQLELLHRGKVRDSFRIDDQRRLIVVTDRISAFDLKIKTPIARKGEILNQLAAFWFDQTKHIVANHVLHIVDGQAMVVRECTPLKVEMVVRGAISGSMWRAYKAGARMISGVTVPDGLTENQLLQTPIVTPTTKEESDREITPADIVATGLVDAQTYAQMADIALQLFDFGRTVAATRGLILADTKYEFGLADGKLMLIDEIHTADSSRFWDAEAYVAAPAQVPSFDKEYVRQWMRAHQVDGALPLLLPDDVAAETSRRYALLYERLTGMQLPVADPDPLHRLYRNLVAHKLIADGYVAIVMGSRADLPWCESIAHTIKGYDVAVDLRILSAHKNGERMAEVVREYNGSLEPGAIVAVAGQSNGLGGALAANVNLPVINCPPFHDDTDYLVNVHSSLRMPSKVPAATVIKPELAAQAAVRSLNLRRLRDRMSKEIEGMKATLLHDDGEVRHHARHSGHAAHLGAKL